MQIAKKLLGLNPFSQIKEKLSFFFVINVMLNRQYTKLQKSQKYYWENFKITDHEHQISALKIIVFLANIGYLVKLLSNH